MQRTGEEARFNQRVIEFWLKIMIHHWIRSLSLVNVQHLLFIQELMQNREVEIVHFLRFWFFCEDS